MDKVSMAETEAQSYAWNWFALHAGQRLQLVNFWLISVAFLVAAFVQAKVGHLTTVAVAVAATGVASSLAFMLLDARTRQLVHAAEAALRYLEERRSNEGLSKVTELVRTAHSERSFLRSYRTIVQGLQASMVVIFMLAAVYSLLSS